MKYLGKLLILLAWLIIELAGLAFAERVTFAWDDIPQPYTRLRTHVFALGPNGNPSFLAEAPGMALSVTAEMEPGVYQVVAYSEWSPGNWGTQSDAITVVVNKPERATWELIGNRLSVVYQGVEVLSLKLSILTSPDLRTWIEGLLPSSRFARIKIESP